MGSKIKELHLRYVMEDFERMLVIKESKKMNWEDLVYFAITKRRR